MQRKVIMCVTILLCGLLSNLSAYTSYVREIPILLPIGLDGPTFTPKAIFPCNDNSVVVVGEISALSDDTMIIYSACIIKLDSLGNRLWQSFATIGSNAPVNVVGINIDSQNTVYYIIEYQVGYDIYKTDVDGSCHLVSHNNNLGSLTQINRAIRLPNGEIIAVGKGIGQSPYSQYNTRYYAFMRMSATGDSLAYQQYPPGYWFYNYGANAYDMELDFDGLPIAVCKIDSAAVSVVKFDLDGNILQRNDWTNDGNSDSYRISRGNGLNQSLIGFKNALGFKVLKFVDNSFEEVIQIQGNKNYDSMLEFSGGFILAGKDYDVHQSTVNKYNISGNLSWSWINPLSSWIGMANYAIEKIATCQDSCIVYVGDGTNTLNIVKLMPDGQVPVDDEVVYPVKPFIEAYPNPMRKKVTFTIDIDSQNKTKRIPQLSIYNLKGQLVRKLDLHSKSDNQWTAIWDGRDNSNKPVSSGVYFYRLNYEGKSISKKIIMMK